MKFFNQTDSNLGIAISLSKLQQVRMGKRERKMSRIDTDFEKKRIRIFDSVLWKEEEYTYIVRVLNRVNICCVETKIHNPQTENDDRRGKESHRTKCTTDETKLSESEKSSFNRKSMRKEEREKRIVCPRKITPDIHWITIYFRSTNLLIESRDEERERRMRMEEGEEED